MSGPQGLFSPRHPAFVPQQQPKPFPPSNQGGGGFGGGSTPGTPGGIEDSQILSVSARKINLVGAKVYNSGTQACADGVARFLAYDVVAFDEGEFFQEPILDRLFCPYNGIYLVSAYAEFVADPTGRRRLTIVVNGVNDISDVIGVTTAASAMSAKIIGVPMRRTAGDYLQMEVYQNSGAGLNVNAGETNNFLSAILIGGI